jgi:uncharacterized protein YbjT (DUF2867 family)
MFQVSEKKIIAVVGATGAQGGGLARAILADPNGDFAVRAITRNAGSDRAKALADAGAEVVEADLTDQASVERAFAGAYGVYLVTNFWEHGSPAKELAEAEVGANAAKAAGVRHVIWSTLEDTRNHLPLSDERVPVLEGRYTVPHFDAKAEANELFTARGIPTTFLQTTFYYEAFIAGMPPSRDSDGALVLTFPMSDAQLSGVASEDIGRTAYGIFKRGDEFIGKTVSVAGDHLTGDEYAALLTKALGEPVGYRPFSFDEFRALGFPFAEEIGNMFQFYAEAQDDFVGARDLKLVRELNPELQSFDTWLEQNKDRIPR